MTEEKIEREGRMFIKLVMLSSLHIFVLASLENCKEQDFCQCNSS